MNKLLYDNKWLSLYEIRNLELGVEGYVYSHETRCRGRIVAILPFRKNESGKMQYLVKHEITPCWGFDQKMSSITGGYEGKNIKEDAVREILEETGYTITQKDLIPLGQSFASKSSDTVYDLFSVNLTGKKQEIALGDGSRVESESESEWVDEEKLVKSMDPQIFTMLVRFKKLNEK